MSLTSTLQSSSLPFPIPSSIRQPATSRDVAKPFHHEPDYINLNRMLIRYQHLILLTPYLDSESTRDLTPLQKQIQGELWSPLPFHRKKWLRNIEGARNILLQLERSVQNIKAQRQKQAAQKDLAEKRVLIKKLRNRVEEIGREVEAMGDEAYRLPSSSYNQGESVWDIVQKRSASQNIKSKRNESMDDTLEEGRAVTQVSEVRDEQTEEASKRNELFESSSTLRRRGGQESSTPATGEAYSTGASGMNATERALLDATRTQENMTTDLLSMATQLKQQSKAINFSIENEDKGLVSRAIEALDSNATGMAAASKNMAFLTRMSEGEGWFGRMKLYVLIFGMWVIAILLVFVGPKLRF